MNQKVKEKKCKKFFLFFIFSKKNNIIRISTEILNEIKEKNKIEEIRYNKLLEEQKCLPKLLPLLKPIDEENSQDYSFDYSNDNYDEKNYKKNNSNNYINKNRFYKNNIQYYNRDYYNNNINYYKNNYKYSYNTNIKINDSLNKDFEEFKFFQQFINLKYAPLNYKNY